MNLKKTILLISAFALVGVGCTKDELTSKPVEPVKLNFQQSVYSLDDRKDWYQALQWPEGCEADFNLLRSNSESGLSVYSLAPDKYLVRVFCSATAYLETAVFMLATTNPATGSVSATVLTMETYDHKTKTFTPIKDERGFSYGVGATTFDDSTKTWQNFAKYREAGDCGQVYTYAIENEAVKLTRLQIRECLEKPVAPEKNWPEVYRR